MSSTPGDRQDPYSGQGDQGNGYGSAPPPPNYYGGGMTPPTPPPPNHLVFAILATIFCCLPLGVISIVYSTQVNSKWAAGDVAGAQEASSRAKKFAILAVIAFFILLIVYGILVAIGLANMDMSQFDTSNEF